MSAAQRRRQRRLRAAWRHEKQSIAAALATSQHHSALGGQKKARAGEGDFELNFAAKIRRHPHPQAAGTVYYPMDVDDVPAARGSRPDRLLDVSGPQERVQRRTVEQLVDSPPVVPSLDAPVPLMVEQLADVLSLVAEYEKEMDRIEDLILVGSPVSTADREAWRRLVNSSSSSVKRKKKRRKRKLPKTAAVGGAVLRRARGVRDAGNCGYSAVAVHRQAGGRARWQTMDAVEKIPLVRVFVEQIVVCQCHRSWWFSS